MHVRFSVFDIVCGANLYWETTLWQRPHHIISRLSKDRRILYVRPIDFELYVKSRSVRAKAGLSQDGNIFLYSPFLFPLGSRFPAVRSVNNLLMTWRVKSFLERKKFRETVLWLYSPMSHYLIGKLNEKLLVYDCMDDHASFRNAGGDLSVCEEKVLELSDIVFTGGKSLYEYKKEKNRSTWLFPSAVDSVHFTKALDEKTSVPQDLKKIKLPVLGYFGAVDERLNYPLIDKLAQKNREWSFVFIGPVKKVSGSELPVGKNIHFFGEREYSDLPAYIKGFSIGFMPFALNRHTVRISPTKTLEYLASGCPVVSTPVPDVVSTFGGIIDIANDCENLSQQIRKVLAAPRKSKNTENGLKVAFSCSWDGMVEKMLKLVQGKIRVKMGAVPEGVI
ncbi:MAG: glycosyltransferase [Nitrospinota bacterium]